MTEYLFSVLIACLRRNCQEGINEDRMNALELNASGARQLGDVMAWLLPS